MLRSYTQHTTAWDKRFSGWVSSCQPRPISNFPAPCMIRPRTHPTRSLLSDSVTVCTPLSFQDTLRGTWASPTRLATGLSGRCPWPGSYPILFASILALASSSHVDHLRGETIAASKFADAMFDLALEQGFQGFSAMAIAQRGAVLIAGAHAEEGISQLREGLDHSAGAFEVMRTLYLASLAGGYGVIGRVEEGFAALAEAMALVESTGVCLYEAELNRLKGELTLKRPEAGSNSKVQTILRRGCLLGRGPCGNIQIHAKRLSLSGLGRGKRRETIGVATTISAPLPDGVFIVCGLVNY
jgi:hypothetical protein